MRDRVDFFLVQTFRPVLRGVQKAAFPDGKRFGAELTIDFIGQLQPAARCLHFRCLGFVVIEQLTQGLEIGFAQREVAFRLKQRLLQGRHYFLLCRRPAFEDSETGLIVGRCFHDAGAL